MGAIKKKKEGKRKREGREDKGLGVTCVRSKRTSNTGVKRVKTRPSGGQRSRHALVSKASPLPDGEEKGKRETRIIATGVKE